MCADLIPGDVPRLSVTLTDSTGALIDPTAITLTIVAPGALPVVMAPVRDGVGLFHVDYPVSVAGSYKYRWASAGTGQAAVENGFYVNASTL